MIARPIVGEIYEYRGRTIIASFMGPDLIGYVDDVELAGFFIDLAAARGAGERYVDAQIAAAEEEQRKQQQGRKR